MKPYDNTVSPYNVVFKSGKGSVLTDSRGRKYIDLLAGVAVNLLGYNDKGLLDVVEKQIKKYIHLSRLFEDENRKKLAALLIKNSFGSNVYFVNSGAEATEVAMKLARKWGILHKKGACEIITMQNSFHGRTIAALSATGQKKFHKGFGPLLTGFKYANFNDITSVKKLLTKKTAAIMVEPVQGEGGVVVAKREFLSNLRNLCDRNKLLLIFDEIQTGLGRCGELFAYQRYGIEPDVLTLAKALGGGLPLGATIVKERFAKALGFGDHGSTFGGNPLACAAANEVLALIDKKMLNNVNSVGNYFTGKLKTLKSKYGIIREVRGMGLMTATELKIKGADIVKTCQEKGLLINCTQDTVLRFLPPLIINRKDVDKAISILDSSMGAKIMSKIK